MKTETAVKHTPTPWGADLSTIRSINPNRTEADDDDIDPIVCSVINRADAAYIVRAVNLYEEIINSQKAMLQLIENMGLPGNFSDSMKKDWQSIVDNAKQAIAKAEGL